MFVSWQVNLDGAFLVRISFSENFDHQKWRKTLESENALTMLGKHHFRIPSTSRNAPGASGSHWFSHLKWKHKNNIWKKERGKNFLSMTTIRVKILLPVRLPLRVKIVCSQWIRRSKRDFHFIFLEVLFLSGEYLQVIFIGICFLVQK